MEALKIVRSEPASEEARRSSFRSDPDESGIRAVPTAEDDLPDLTDQVVELRAGRRASPPPIPVDPKRADAAIDDDEYEEKAISLVDFDAIAKSCPPKIAGNERDALGYPSVPGIPAGFRISSTPPPAKAPFDHELAIHVAVVWLSALVGGLLAL